MYGQGLLALHIDVCCVSVADGVSLARRLSRRCGCSRREHKCTNAAAVFLERAGEVVRLLLLASEWLYCVG